MRSVRAKREIRKNIHGLIEHRLDTASIFTKTWLALACVFIALALPIASYFTAANIAFKINDVYNYELDRTGAAQAVAYGASSDDVGSAVSTYMKHGTDRLTIVSSKFDEEIKVFSANDEAVASVLRKLLDMVFITLMVLWPLLLVAFVLVVRVGGKGFLRVAFRCGTAVFIILFAGIMVFANAHALRAKLLSAALGIVSADGDALPELFSQSFPLVAGVIISIIALVFFGPVYYFATRFFRKSKLFRGRRGKTGLK